MMLLLVLSCATRLPGNTVPLSYTLDIQPDYDHLGDSVVFDGQVKILIAVQNRSSVITLNNKNLLIYVVYVHERYSMEETNVIDIQQDVQNEQFHIILEVELDVSTQYVLSIEYQGKNQNSLDGFYKSTYVNSDGYTE